MPKFPKPFFRTARKAWFVPVAGKQVNLGPDHDVALRRYHELMGRANQRRHRGSDHRGDFNRALA
jgi:hypothetical protein